LISLTFPGLTMIRPASTDDAAAIAAIYNHYVASTTITFEESAVSAEEMAQRIGSVSANLPWCVFEEGGQVLGYAYATPWRARSAYRYSVESTVYVSHLHPRKGIGSALYRALLAELGTRGIHMVFGGIAQPNAASVALHEHMRFVKVAHFNQVGRKFEKWIDVGYWELALNSMHP
jgi:phosphinothricin acetyltransferase